MRNKRRAENRIEEEEIDGHRGKKTIISLEKIVKRRKERETNVNV